MSDGSAFGRILLITGSGAGAEFLAERMRARALESVLAGEPDCEVTMSSAGSLAAGVVSVGRANWLASSHFWSASSSL